jgi:protocatechuate 3,4-dioxygenase beta subunit
MRSKLPIVLVAAVAVAFVALLALGDPLGLFGPGGRSDEGEGREAGLEVEGTGEEGEAAVGARSRGPSLFGAESFKRKGQGAVRGRVLDVRTAKGVPGATLMLTGIGHGKESVAARAVSAADGTFAWHDVAAGEGYALRVESVGVGARNLPGIEVRAAQATDLGDLWLGKAGTIVGKVVGPDGQPVAKAGVELHRGSTSLRELFMSGGFLEFFRNLEREPEPLLRQESKSDGGFRFEAVSPGPHVVVVRSPGFRQALLGVTLTGEGTTEEVTVRLVPGATVAGKVVDAQGRGIAGVTLVSMPQDAGIATPLARVFARSGDDGSFRFDTLANEDDVTLIAAAAGYPNTLAQVEAGDQAVRIVLKRGATLELRIVRDSDGTPIEGAEILCSVGEASQLGDQGPATLLPGTTDRGGLVVLEAPPGHMQMLVVSHADRPTGIWMKARGMGMPGMLKGPEDVSVPEGRKQLTFRAPDGIWMTGRVLDADDRPIAGAEVSVMSFMGSGQKVLSGEDGAFRIAADRTVSGSLRATLHGWVQEKVDYGDASALRQPDVKEVKVDIRMRAAVAVTGRVLTPDGKPLGGATVAIHRVKEKGDDRFELDDMMGLGTPTSLSLQDGTYVVDGVPAGRKVRVLARHAAYVDAGTDGFDSAAVGVTQAPDVRMLVGASLRVRVTTNAERPVQGARIRVDVERSDGVEGSRFEAMMAAQLSSDDVHTDAAGKATIELLPPGKVTLRVSAAGHAPWGARHTITNAAADAGEVTIVLPPGVVLSGTVVDAQGQPVAEARVQIMNGAPAEGGDAASDPDVSDRWQEEWDRARKTVTDREGRWRVADLPERALFVRVSKDGFTTRLHDPGTAREAIQVRLEVQSADAKARLAEIDAELMKLYQRLSDKGGDQKALLEQIRELQSERQRLGGEDG